MEAALKELADTGTLQAFIAVANALSFSDGAKRAGLTRSAASKAIARLEDLLGSRLLHRTTRRVSLTADGQAFYESATRVLADLADAQTAVSHSGRLRGVLRVTAPEAFGRQVILPLLSKYLTQWPELSAEASFTDRPIDIVEEGFDCAFRFGELPVQSELIARVVARSVGQLCASPIYLTQQPACVTIEDLTQHRQLLSGTRDRPRGWALRTGTEPPHSIAPRPTLLCDNAGALRDAALAGLGVACLPTFLIRDDIAAGRLQMLLPEYTTPEFPIAVLYPSRRQLPKRARLFIDTVVQYLSSSKAALT